MVQPSERLPHREKIPGFVLDLVANHEPGERPFEGKVGIVTGTRDISGGIALALALRGTRIIGIHRDEKKTKRSQPVINVIERYSGVPSKFIVGDVTKQDDRNRLEQTLAEPEFGGELDFLILSASGPNRDINVDANNALITQLLPRMRKGGKILLMQSLPGHLAHKLRGQGLVPPFYEEVMEPKHEGEATIRAREAEMREYGVSLVVVLPTIVPDTTNMGLFRMYDKTIDEKHNAISDALGLPHQVPISEVAMGAVKVLANDVPFGYTELFAKANDAYGILDKWYGENAIHVDTIDQNGVGRAIIGLTETQIEGDSPCFDLYIENKTGDGAVADFTVTTEHAKGHFKPETGLVIYPGHKSLRAVTTILSEKIFSQEYDPQFSKTRIVGFKSITFDSPILPGDNGVSMEVTTFNQREHPDFGLLITGDATVQVNGEQKVTVNNLACTPTMEENSLPEDVLLEAAAQTAGMTALRNNMDQDVVPLFQSVGESSFFRTVNPGDAITLETTMKEGSRRTFTADVLIKRGEDIVAEIHNLKALVVPRAVLNRMTRKQTVS